MPGSVRKDDKAKRIALDILGIPPSGIADSFGEEKKYIKRKKKKKYNRQEFKKERREWPSTENLY